MCLAMINGYSAIHLHLMFLLITLEFIYCISTKIDSFSIIGMVERKGHVPMRYRFMLIHHQLDVLNNAEIDRKSILTTGVGGGETWPLFLVLLVTFFIIYLKNGPAIAFIMKAAPPLPYPF